MVLARRAARTLRQVMPGTPIDLFADRAFEDTTFDTVHRLEGRGRRPKMEALRRSRFDRTLYLDCDVIALADPSEIFALLDYADLAGAHEHYGSAPIAMQSVRDTSIPPSFRQINSGVLGVRKSAATDAFLARWQDDFEALKLQFDQPLLRELLWKSDLRLAVLPQEYNLMHMPYLTAGNEKMMAPRLLHLPHLHVGSKFTDDPSRPLSPAEILSDHECSTIAARFATDRTLGASRDLRVLAADMLRKAPALDRTVRGIWNRFR
ncbi:putative nucleotide-diphospho-sugar transferase [Palleronia aestuarii]|uniref:putative nucleotide-diphospho-sugar transferase n=1 Tax=Palleronia aestuarii TaxID=568105 RepID=UPI0014746FBF|nr:putative nucleotide-diphospho-sugar transferase [Palleronia aestuarii]